MKKTIFSFGFIFVCTMQVAGVYASARDGSLLINVQKACTVLGISSTDDVSPKAITKKYRTAAKLVHPDRYEGSKEDAEKLFKAIGAAYELLQKNMSKISYALTRCSKKSMAGSKLEEDLFADIHQNFDETDFEFCSFEEAWAQSTSVEKPAKRSGSITYFSTDFVKKTIFWVNNREHGVDTHPDTGEIVSCKHLTSEMELCSKWLQLMRYVKCNNLQEVIKILEAYPGLVNVHDGIADPLSLHYSADRKLPAFLRRDRASVLKILLDHGAVSGFPFYDGGGIGFSKGYMY